MLLMLFDGENNFIPTVGLKIAFSIKIGLEDGNYVLIKYVKDTA